MGDIALTLGAPKTGAFVLNDNKSGQPIADAVLSNQAVGANSNPEVATFALDTNNNPVGTPVASGAGTVVFTSDAAYTDPGDNSAQTKTGLSVSKNFAVITGPDGVSLDVVF